MQRKAAIETSNLGKLILAALFIVIIIFLIAYLNPNFQNQSNLASNALSGDVDLRIKTDVDNNNKPKTETTTVDPNSRANITNQLKINTQDIDSVRKVSEKSYQKTTTATAGDLNSIPDLGSQIENAINSRLVEREIIEADITTSVEVIEVKFATGEIKEYSRITKEIEFKDLPDLKNVELIQLVPKIVTDSASNIIGNFEILVNDPLISFQLENSTKTQIKIDYMVPENKTLEAAAIQDVLIADSTGGNSVTNILLSVVIILLLVNIVVFIFNRLKR